MPLPTLPLPVTVAPGDPGHATLHNNVNSVGNYLVSDSQAQNAVLAAPVGAAGAGVFRLLTSADLPVGQGTGVLVRDQAPTITNAILNGATTDVNSFINGFSAFFQTLNGQTSAAATVLQLDHNSTGTPTTNFGTSMTMTAQDSTTPSQSMVTLRAFWANATHASRVANLAIRLNSAAVSADVLTISPTTVTLADPADLGFGTTTGTKIGTAAAQKLSLWGKTPQIQPTNGIAAAAFVANTSLIANDTATFGGYTIGQVVAALIRIGALT